MIQVGDIVYFHGVYSSSLELVHEINDTEAASLGCNDDSEFIYFNFRSYELLCTSFRKRP